mgnify:CR=1 FL=1
MSDELFFRTHFIIWVIVFIGSWLASIGKNKDAYSVFGRHLLNGFLYSLFVVYPLVIIIYWILYVSIFPTEQSLQSLFNTFNHMN